MTLGGRLDIPLRKEPGQDERNRRQPEQLDGSHKLLDGE